MSECFARRLSRMAVDQEKWMNRYFRKLASLYRKSPCLWKKDTPNYLDSERRHRAYARIHRAMDLPGVTFVEMVLKIREMRRLYVNELRKLLEAESRGHCYQITLAWFYDLHRFLYPYLDYDEAVELHNVGESVEEPREKEEREPRRPASDCSCVRCPISGKNSGGEDSSSRKRGPRAFPSPNSSSSPGICLAEVKIRPRTCPRSCSRITDARKQLDRFARRAVINASSTSCHEKLHRHEDTTGEALTGTRQVDQ